MKSFSIFELNLVSFENREGRDFRGGCCSGRLGADGLCPPCPVYLRVCIKHYQVIVDPASPCTFAEVVTPLLQATNSTSEDDQGLMVLNERDTMIFDLNFTWPVSKLSQLYFYYFVFNLRCTKKFYPFQYLKESYA